MRVDVSSRSEDGAVLMLALIFMTTIGLITGALVGFGQSSTNQVRSTRVVTVRETGTNAGMDWAIQAIKSHSPICLGPSGAYQPLTINEREVRVHCKVTEGSAAGPGGWAIYLNGGVLSTFAGGGAAKTIVGPVYNSGSWDLKAPLTVDGFVRIPESDPTTDCKGKTSAIPNPPAPELTTLFNNFELCTTSLAAVQPRTLLTAPTNICGNTRIAGVTKTRCSSATGEPVDIVDAAGVTICRVFSPGKYGAPPIVAPNNYFKAGVYSFDWDPPPAKPNTWVITGAVRAGDPGPGEQVEGTIPKCAPETGPAPVYPNTAPHGAVFVFGRQARMDIRQGGRVEIFSYKDGNNVIPGIVTKDVIPLASTGFEEPAWANASTIPGYLVNIGQGSRPELVVHAGIYAPGSSVRLRATYDGYAKIMATAVVENLMLDGSASPLDGHFGVYVPTGNAFKKFSLVAISTPKIGEPPLCTRAAVTVFNDPASTLGVDAWRVDRDATGLDPADCSP